MAFNSRDTGSRFCTSQVSQLEVLFSSVYSCALIFSEIDRFCLSSWPSSVIIIIIVFITLNSFFLSLFIFSSFLSFSFLSFSCSFSHIFPFYVSSFRKVHNLHHISDTHFSSNFSWLYTLFYRLSCWQPFPFGCAGPSTNLSLAEISCNKNFVELSVAQLSLSVSLPRCR